MLRHVRVHSRRGKTQNLRSTKDATEATYSCNKRRRHFPVLVSSNNLGAEVCSHRCLVGALGGMLCVRQHQCDQRSKPKLENCAAKKMKKNNGFTFSKSSTIFFFFFSSHTFTFQLLDKPWSQVSSLLPPGACLQFLSRIGFSNPTACQFSIDCCLPTLSRFPHVNLCTRKNPNEFIRVCTQRGSNSRN